MSLYRGGSALPTDPESRIILAGEYVLGTLDAATARAVQDAMIGDAALTALVQEFERRLAPLVAMSAPEAPPVELWSRIEAAISPKPRVAPARPARLRLWQGWAVGASLAAVAFAGLALLPPRGVPMMTGVMLADANQLAWQAAIDRQGALHLAALASPEGAPPDTAPRGHDLQLWAQPPGAKAPVSLGVLPRGQAVVNISALPVTPQPGMVIMISLEPPGGAPGNLPTGKVMFIGRLTQAGPPT